MHNFITIKDEYNNIVAQEITLTNKKISKSFTHYAGFALVNNSHTEQIDVWANDMLSANMCINKICKNLYTTFTITDITHSN